MREAEARGAQWYHYYTSTSQESLGENKLYDFLSQRKSHSVCKAVVGVKMKKEFIPKPRNLIFDLSDIFHPGVFRVQMGSFLWCAQNSELKIGVPGASRILVAGSGPHWQ